MMGEYGVPLSLRETGISMLLMPTGVVIEDDTVKLTYHYAESGGLAVLAVSLTDGACMCEMLHLMGGEGVNVSWDNITNKPEGIEPAIVVLSGSPVEPSSWEAGKQKLRDAAVKGLLPVAMNSSTMKLYRAVVAFGSAGADCAALFVDDNARTVRVNVSSEGVVTCTAHTPLDETSVVQETGAGTDKIMSQDAVTKKLINTLTLTGDVTGTGTPADGTLSVATTIHGAAKTVTLTGAVTGSGTAEDGTATVDTTLSGSVN